MHANWISPNVNSGSGNGAVNVSAETDNTGRNARSTNLTFKASGCADVVRTVNQAGKPEFVTIESAKSVGQNGGSAITISGTSNSKKLTFALANGNTLQLTLPSAYVASSLSTNNGADISGDPGATQEYNFSITFADPGANSTIEELTAQLIVTADGGQTATCTITQAAGDATLSVSPASVSLAWNAYTEGDTAAFTVTSNTNWTVE